MLHEKDRQTRHHAKAGEGHGRADAQVPRQGCGRAARGKFRLLGFLDRPFGALVEISARLGWRQTVRRTQKQTHAEAILELGNRLRDGSELAQAKLLGRAGERFGLDDANKGFHRGQPIHFHSLVE
jgi:hypothetical protein